MRRWKLFGITAVVGLAIVIVSPNYLDLQRAADADRFRELVAVDGDTRVAIGAVLDFAFAVLYAVTVFVFVGGRRHLRPGLALVVAGALFDQVENSFVLRGALDPEGLTDGAVGWMRRFGTMKSAALIVGFVALAVGAFRARTAPSPRDAAGQ